DQASLREDLRKAQELRACAERDTAGLKSQVAGLQKDQAGLRDELKKAQELRVGAERDTTGLKSQLTWLQKDQVALGDQLKKAQELRTAAERDSAELKAQAVALQKELTGLRDELKKAQDLRAMVDRENASLKGKIADLEKRTREGSKEDPRVVALQRDLAAMKSRAELSETRTAESERYFESMEKALIEARDEADKAEALRAELEKMKEACREHEEGLDQLSETVMELQHQLDSVAGAASAPPSPAVPGTEKAVVAEVDDMPKHPGLAGLAPPLSPFPASKPEPPTIEIDLESPPAPPPPAPKPIVIPSAVAVPSAGSAETTLRSNNTFGPSGPDGQPIYMLHEMLPKDAKGVVYRATHRADGRSFAVRFMGGQAGEEQTQAFEKELEKLISLPHPNILHVQGTGRRKNRLYVMMDLVDAPTLGAAKIREIPRICAILRDAAAAIQYAHEEGIFHGDLNLETILVAKEEEKDLALVKDFGLAFLLETQTAGLRNPAFLPPEQVRVLKSPLSAAVDVYGLGATLFAALTGRAPFEGKDAAQVAKRVMIEEPPPVEKLRPDIPKAVGAVVRRAMAKERGVRYATAGEFSDALSKTL
ncbi:MAG TPA: protein kinase, partial [Planctomycetota bacterium]|nr:protein kinase [Planctomycetota bacterium]